jgi:hypothetical protein
MSVLLTIFVNILQHFLKCWNNIFSFFNLRPVRQPQLAGMARGGGAHSHGARHGETCGCVAGSTRGGRRQQGARDCFFYL